MPTFLTRTSSLRCTMKYTSGCMKKYEIEQVEDDRDAEEEREAPHRADGQRVEHDRADQRHEVGGEDGRNDFSNARSTDERTVRPVRTSSFNFSK